MLPVAETPRPQPLGLRKSFGFGDRLGLATAGHLSAARRFGFGPVFAQTSIRDRERLRQPLAGIVANTRRALAIGGFRGAWGADVAGLKTEGDIDRAVAAGFTWFTLDPSAFIEPRADHLDAAGLNGAIAEAINEGVVSADWIERFGGGRFEIEPGRVLRFSVLDLKRAAVKLGRAVQHAQRLIRRLTQHAFADAWEVEIAFTGATTPTTALEHLFVALELKRRGLTPVAVAPRFATPFEPGIDIRDAPSVFEDDLAWHAAIARSCGPYKISIHGAADKHSILPVIGRVCGDLLHVKVTGLSWLEALRVVCRTSPELFREIARFARGRFVDDRPLTEVATTPEDIDPLLKAAGQVSLENAFLGTPAGRQLLLTTAMSVLTAGTTERGRPLREALVELVTGEAPLYRQLLDEVFTRHLSLLNQG